MKISKWESSPRIFLAFRRGKGRGGGGGAGKKGGSQYFRGGAKILENTMHQAILTFSESYRLTILNILPEFISSNTDIFIEFHTN